MIDADTKIKSGRTGRARRRWVHKRKVNAARVAQRQSQHIRAMDDFLVTDGLWLRPRLVESLTTLSKCAQLTLHPHYTDDRFRKERTVFGREPKNSAGHKGLTYSYSDRLVQWNSDKSAEAWSKAQESKAPRDSALFLEAYLSAYYSGPVEVIHVVAGVNHSNGYPYWVVGWREVKVG